MNTRLLALLAFTVVASTIWTVRPSAVKPPPTTINDFFLPGSQPLQSGDVIPPDQCDNCHGGYDQPVEPAFNWRGSMMSQAARDPLFFATMSIANQDAPKSGDLCLRCHTPPGWLEGRSDSTDGSQLTAVDREGVQCHYCHKSIKPTPLGVNPYPGEPDYIAQTYDRDQTYLATLAEIPPASANGMFVVDSDDTRRGPYAVVESAPHGGYYSPFHKESAICGTCHDVSNPVFDRVGDTRDYVPNAFDQPAPDFSPYALFPVERTYSEWLQSEYNTPIGVYAPQFGGNKDYVSTCQDCHMRDVTGKGCNKNRAPVRDDLPLHDMTGGNTFVPNLIDDVFPGETDPAALAAGIQRATYMLENAATLALEAEWDDTGYTATVTVTNETGHKLPSGYPEGRRMWLNIRALHDEEVVYESGAYDTLTAVLTKDVDAKIYEIKPGVSHSLSPVVNVPPGPSFHFVLNDTIYSDNRIPPRGFTNAAFESIQSPPVAYTYADGQYWDETFYQLPANTDSVEVVLYYQTTSKEYVEFLRDENVTDDWGLTMYNLWANNGMSRPVAMARDTLVIPHAMEAELTIMLQGAFAGGGLMAVPTAFSDSVPLVQPYGHTRYEQTVLAYQGTEWMSTLPIDGIDWVLVSLRTSTAPETEVEGSLRAGLLLADGSIVGPSGYDLIFPGIPEGSYYVVVRHRNHADVISSAPVDFASGPGSWDFTTGLGQAYSGGGPPMVDLSGDGSGPFALMAGDLNGDGKIQALDFNMFVASFAASWSGYVDPDANLDGVVDADDLALLIGSAAAGAASQVP